jgi:hypothetical protein
MSALGLDVLRPQHESMHDLDVVAVVRDRTLDAKPIDQAPGTNQIGPGIDTHAVIERGGGFA